MDLPDDVAKSHPAPRNDGDGIQVVVDAVEVPVHLSIRTTERYRVTGDQSDWATGSMSCAYLGIELIRPCRVPHPRK